jgi:hypothetical protein
MAYNQFDFKTVINETYKTTKCAEREWVRILSEDTVTAEYCGQPSFILLKKKVFLFISVM